MILNEDELFFTGDSNRKRSPSGCASQLDWYRVVKGTAGNRDFGYENRSPVNSTTMTLPSLSR